MPFFMSNRVKKSYKFGEVVLKYGRLVGFQYQLGIFEFYYDLALAVHAKNMFTSNFNENLRFFQKI
jgi:hypothetical protein